MLTVTKKYKAAILTILTILSFSTFIPALAYAQPLAVSDKNWERVNGNSWGWNHSPQTQINKDNVDQLEVKWIFPVGSKSLAPAGMQAINLYEGVNTPPVVKDGVVYILTNFYKTYAIDAKTGSQLWTHDYSIDVETLEARLPLEVSPGNMHGFRYWSGGDVVLIPGMACDIYGLDGKTGEEKFRINDLCANIEGNIFKYKPTGRGLNDIATYEKGRVFIIHLHHSDGTGWGEWGRSVLIGIDMDTHKVVWKVFQDAPQDRSTPDWALQYCDTGFFGIGTSPYYIPCSEAESVNREGLMYDMQPVPGEPPFTGAGSTAAWGQASVDEDTGFIYISTGNQVPWPNVSLTPGPRLYGSSIIAIDMNKGQMVWWLQPMPRDPYDYDCNWGGVLIDDPTLGKVFAKGCKEGVLYVMDAATGEPKYAIDVMEEQHPGRANYHHMDARSYYDMREFKWPENSRYHGDAPVILVPSFLHGVFATDMSYDGEGTLYHYAALYALEMTTLPLVKGQSGAIMSYASYPANVTMVARDVATGEVKWTWFYSHSNQRAHMVVTGDMVFSAFTDGLVRFFDKDTGDLLSTVNLGAPVVIGPTIGKDSDGDSKIFVIAGATYRQGNVGYGLGGLTERVPGTLIAIGLSERAAAEVRTTTVTTTTTTTTRITTTTTSTTTQRTTTTVTSSITRTVTSTTATTITTTLAPQTITTTTTAPAQTITTTQEITETVGLPSTVTYAAVAIAIIAIIAAAVLATRRRP